MARRRKTSAIKKSICNQPLTSRAQEFKLAMNLNLEARRLLYQIELLPCQQIATGIEEITGDLALTNDGQKGVDDKVASGDRITVQEDGLNRANNGSKQQGVTLVAQEGQVEAGKNIEGVGVEQVKKKPTGEDRRLKDIPAATIFARMYTATAGALKVADDRANTSNKPDMVQLVGESGNVKELQDHQLVKEVAALVKSQNQSPTAAMKFSKDGSSILKVVNAVNTTGVAILDGSLATGDEADVQQVQKPVVDHPTTGAQTTGHDGAEVLVNAAALDEAADRSNTIKKVNVEAGQSGNPKEIEANVKAGVFMQQESKKSGHESVQVAANSSSDSDGNIGASTARLNAYKLGNNEKENMVEGWHSSLQKDCCNTNHSVCFCRIFLFSYIVSFIQTKS
ncbi:hypothetical protein A4A49_06788 [Nicotiana attenuata]|uniref:Uncharacterized protein n=1 Tax=Nicotiana attenuata TaxID=49451 RepID=A0A314KW35_NICAT|nr:hypothetical protein A4A49_06788 [Nicotiana attenuata]